MKHMILVVDDNPESIDAIYGNLSGDYRVLVATTGEKALKLARSPERPGLILLDLLMPGMDGCEVCRRLKADPDTRNIPVIFLTASTALEDEEKGLALGAVDFITKPIRPSILRARVKTHLLVHRQRIMLQERYDMLSELHATIVGHAPLGICFVDEKCVVKVWNSFLEQYTATNRESIVNRHLFDALPRLKSTGLPHMVEKVLERGEADSVRTTNLFGGAARCNPGERVTGEPPDGDAPDGDAPDGETPDGETPGGDASCSTFQQVHVSPLSRGGRTFGALLIIDDISSLQSALDEKQRLENQLRQIQKLEAIGTLGTGIAHDFNNILSSILGYSQLAKENLDGSAEDFREVSENISQVIQAGGRARELVEQILHFSRRQDAGFTPLGIDPVIDEVVRLVRSTLPDTIELTHRSTLTRQKVMGDFNQLHQVVMNLVTNARSAILEKSGSGAIRILTDFFETAEDIFCHAGHIPPGPYARITVSDNGGGIPRRILENIFDPYFTTRPQDQGTGLGLAITRGVVAGHGGGIRVRGTPGGGAEFTVYFPAIPDRTDAAPIAPPPDTGNPRRILLVDDEAFFLNLSHKTLSALGHHVVSEHDCSEALETLGKTPDHFDLVITDQTMPKMTGLEFAGEVRKVRPHIPVIICTGFSEHISDRMARQAGVSKIVPKPVTKRDLAGAIRAVFDM